MFLRKIGVFVLSYSQRAMPCHLTNEMFIRSSLIYSCCACCSQWVIGKIAFIPCHCTHFLHDWTNRIHAHWRIHIPTARSVSFLWLQVQCIAFTIRRQTIDILTVHCNGTARFVCAWEHNNFFGFEFLVAQSPLVGLVSNVLNVLQVFHTIDVHNLDLGIESRTAQTTVFLSCPQCKVETQQKNDSTHKLLRIIMTEETLLQSFSSSSNDKTLAFLTVTPIPCWTRSFIRLPRV